ncbi:urease accessory protein UreD [Priestia flexa]|uniref:urease accessory protein UreD n=1 Tax=Priestia flexa TaxID=86664 RepID=UPI000955A5BB|nr:urease accessory protein UreD [Priestia flexa]MBY6085650.1 urease accessory protein UreD [Priestia flexa]SIQ14477.1 urease accessory protein [Priestia flexa]
MSYTGYLKLESHKVKGKTVVYNTYHDGAFKVARPIYMEEHTPTIYLLHVGGGYVGGDRYKACITAEEGAHLCLTTQAATKVYRTPNAPVVQETELLLKKGAVIEYLPDPLILYEDAQFIQETTVHMEEKATFFISDVITPGWSPNGEIFKYDSLRSKLKVYQNNQLMVFDHLFLSPHEDIHAIMKMEGYTHFGSFLAVAEGIIDSVIDELYDEVISEERHGYIGISKLAINGCAIRILGNDTKTLESIINRCFQFLRKRLLGLDVVHLRKY